MATCYSKRYYIPDWDDKGNCQTFIEQPDGTWLDGINETYLPASWIDEHIAPYFKLAPEGMSLEDYMKQG